MVFDSLAKLNSASRNAISAALVIIVAIALYNWTVAPHVTYLFAVQRYQSVIDDIVKKNKILNSAVRTKKKKLERLHEQFAQLQSSLFTASQAKEFFSDLQAISVQAGCSVYSVSLIASKQNSEDEPSENASAIDTESAVLSVIGTYSDILALIERLQARPQKVWIDSVTIAPLDDNAGQLRCDLTITIAVIQNGESTGSLA